MPPAVRTLTLRLDARRQEAVRRLAERAGLSEEEAVLDAVEQMAEAAEPRSMLALAGDLIGSLDGPPDLSTNKDYMSGFGEKKRGPRTRGADEES
jgi:hypothetical protein